MDTAERQSVHQKNSSNRKPWEDEVLREVYVGRDAHAAQFGNDATQIYLDLLKKGKLSNLYKKRRLVPTESSFAC